MKLLKIFFYLFLLILFIFIIFSYKESIILLSPVLYYLFLTSIVFFINYFFLFTLYELAKFFFLIFISDGKIFTTYSIGVFFSDSIDVMNIKEIEDIKFTKNHILNVLLDFGRIIFNDNKSDKKILFCIDEPEKIVEILIGKK